MYRETREECERSVERVLSDTVVLPKMIQTVERGPMLRGIDVINLLHAVNAIKTAISGEDEVLKKGTDNNSWKDEEIATDVISGE